MSVGESLGVHRPRNVDWKRAAAIVYGDLGTSKTYVIGLAFVAACYSSLPLILAVCALTALVAVNYVVICKHFPDGGGVYSAARDQSRTLAVIGALLLVLNLTVTACLSGWTAICYLGTPPQFMILATLMVMAGVGVVNWYGPRHSGSLAAFLAIPTVIVVVVLIVLSLPHLTTEHLQPPLGSFGKNWMAFVGVILALSGIETVANLTGVMKLDEGASADHPKISRTIRWTIWPVVIEVVLGTALLGWAMLSLPSNLSDQIISRKEDMLRFLAEQYGSRTALGPVFGQTFGWVAGIVFALLLISAVNTAVVALIGLMYMMARDGEMPKPFTRLNSHGVPRLPLIIATILPMIVVALIADFESLANLYAIGVVGAIAVNVGSCSFNKKLDLNWRERSLMFVTFLVLLAVELTVAKTKHDALFFACVILALGMGLRTYTQRRAGWRSIMVPTEVAASVETTTLEKLQARTEPAQRILVAARGLTPVLRFALEEARLRGAALYVLYVKELAVSLPGVLTTSTPARWQDDPEAAAIMYGISNLAKPLNVAVVPVYAISGDPPAIITDLSATLGIDLLVLGASRRRFLAQWLKGDVISRIAGNLPENIDLVIHG